MESALQATFRTGNPIIDSFIAVFVASVFTAVVAYWNSTIKPFLLSIPGRIWKKKALNYYYRTITYKVSSASKTVSDEHARTLQLAIINRIHQDKIRFVDVNLLMQTNGVNETTEWFDLVIKQLPAVKLWHTVADKVDLYIEKEMDDIRDSDNKVIGKQESTTFTLRSADYESVENYYTKAWEMAVAEPRQKVLAKINQKKRYYYDISLNHRAVYLQDKEKSTTANAQDFYYASLEKKNKLHTTKTFDSIFFPGRTELVLLLDHFINKTGKYAVKGCQHKLGLLLHGEPGTGKTSLVKALAAYLGRSIVNVDPRIIQNNKQLHQLLFNLEVNSSKHVSGVEALDADKVIYLFEEIDVVEVFNKRTPAAAVQLDMMDMDDILDDSDPEEDQPLVMTRKDKRKMALARLERLKAKRTEREEFLKAMKTCAITEMDLQGMLTALDGVEEAPGRVVIMTTNFPEKLDPALRRPGRVDCDLYLTYMVPQDMCSLIDHYFVNFGQTTTTEHHSRLADLPTKITAAQLESLCKAKSSIEEVLQVLESMKPKPLPEPVAAAAES